MKKKINYKFDINKIPLKNNDSYKEGCAHTLNKKTDKKRITKYKKERIKYGFDSTILWNLDYEIAKYLVPRLIMFKLYNHAIIPTFALSKEDQNEISNSDNLILTVKGKAKAKLFKKRKELYEKSHIEWEKILNQMIEGFQLVIDYDYKKNLDYDERSDKQQLAIDLLAKYFNHLWN